MKQIEYFFNGLRPLENLTKICNSDDILYFDIETTGLSRKNNHIYLIGVGHYIDNGLRIIQWFADNEDEEVLVLSSFLDYSSSFLYLLNYNGKSFDIPFTEERMSKYGFKLPDITSIDLYLYTKPLKKLLSLCDLTQKSIEQFLNIKRKDKYNGGELIYTYKKYVLLNSKNSSTSKYIPISFDNCINDVCIYNDEQLISSFKDLLLHNMEDVLNMHYLSDILYYNDISSAKITYNIHEIKEYTDYSGSKKKELVLYGLHNFNFIPKGFNSFKNDGIFSYIMNFNVDGSIKLRVPTIETTLFYFFSNYKDYYYLESEDMCILKDMSGGVAKDNLKKATKENCKVKLKDIFIPLSPLLDNKSLTPRLFKESYNSKQFFMRVSDFELLDEYEKSIILSAYYQYFSK